MTICPKCGQASSNDKVCSNCWADLSAKNLSAKKSPVNFEEKWKQALLLAAGAIVVVYLLGLVLDAMKPAEVQEQAPAQQQQQPNPTPVGTVQFQ